MKIKNYYQILDIDPFVSQDEIRRAYARQLKEFHPDKKRDFNSFAHKRFQAVLEAYEALKTPEKRASYDRLLKIQISNSRTAASIVTAANNDNLEKKVDGFFVRLIKSLSPKIKRS
jgi:DnaJ-class molecular chaperone